MKPTISCSELFSDQNLSSEAISIIQSDSFFLNYLISERDKFPLPAFYTPQEVEIRFNNILILKLEQGEIVYFSQEQSKQVPVLIEWRFDDECALLQSNKQILIDRTTDLEIFADLKTKIQPLLDLEIQGQAGE